MRISKSLFRLHIHAVIFDVVDKKKSQRTMSTGYFISLCSNNRTRSKFLSVYYYLSAFLLRASSGGGAWREEAELLRQSFPKQGARSAQELLQEDHKVLK